MCIDKRGAHYSIHKHTSTADITRLSSLSKDLDFVELGRTFCEAKSARKAGALTK